MTSLVLGLCLSSTPGQLPPPPPVVVAAPAVLTLDQFSRAFTPTPGTHHVWLVHPRTCQPVQVCFTLPNCGKLERFRVTRRAVEFDFCKPHAEVRIVFRLNGTVDVRYN